ncbi:SLAP domain-containing protein [Lactobacillus rodentium]|uniref:SLAP domain-containing protein n=1 Tax=Lactobacillus rodentium TaxID=947835 RepID=UPI001FE735F5
MTGKQQVNGSWWYRVGTNQWIDGRSLYVTGVSSIPVVNATSNNSSSNNTNSNSNATSGVGHINYVPGYGINLWIGYGSDAHWSGRRLPHGTRWKFYKKVTVNGKTWYNLGGNQWIDGAYFVVD